MSGLLPSTDGYRPFAIVFILPIALGAMLIANSALNIEMINKEKEDKKEIEDKSGVPNFMIFMNAVIIVISTLLIGISLFYGIYYVLPKEYKIKVKDYFDSEKRKAEKIKEQREYFNSVERDLTNSAKYYDKVNKARARGASEEEIAKLEANRFKKQ